MAIDDLHDSATFTTFPGVTINITTTTSSLTLLHPEVTGSDDNNVTWSAGDWAEVDDVARAAVVGTILMAMVLCTVVGNVMVLLAVFVNSHLRSTTNYFIVNLAIADLLLGTMVLPLSASLEVFKKWLFGPVVCDIWAAIDVLCCTASIFSLCVISIDRYIGVTRPLQRSTIMTERRAVYVILAIWLLAVAISVAPLFGWKEEKQDADPYECSVTTQTGYVLFSVSTSFYIPLFIILLVYFRIYREALRHSRFLMTGVKTTKVDESGVTLRVHKGSSTTTAAIPVGQQSSSSSERSDGSVGHKVPSRVATAAGKVAKFKRETKAAKTLGIVVGVFILCWFPFFFILPLGSLCPSCNIPPLLFNVFFWLGYGNSLVNPIIYACSSREFQFAFRRILRCQFRRRPRVFLADHDEKSNSCYDFNQIDASSTRSRSFRRTFCRSCRRSKSQKGRVTRSFKTNMWSTRRKSHNQSVPINMHSYDTTPSSNEVRLTESSTESLRELQRQIGTLKQADWSPSSHPEEVNFLGREHFQNEDVFNNDLTNEETYLSCGAR
ncbi:LOW QUALITY PROTEIN: alpha-1A adrenergic receptor-like [Babylonia areolata]|uniref:LOW QUALITY PROTEIN: alpha-1A adrenergic receptor-like n=1 Tax=Babylonia areolata TaxID=304850 RepID=UPI003FCF9AB0